MTEFNLKKQNLKEDIFIFSLSFIMVLISINIIFSYVSNEDSKYLKKEVKKIENEIKQYEEQNKKLSEKMA